MLRHLSLLFLLLAFLAPAALAATITFDPAAEPFCLTGCSFSNATIWIGGVVPAQNDTAIIIGFNNYTSQALIFTPLLTDVVTTISSLVVQGVTFAVSYNTTLVSTTVAINANATLIIHDLASLKGDVLHNGTFTTAVGATLSVEGAGSFLWHYEVYLNGTITTSATATINWYYAAFSPATYTIGGLLQGNQFNILYFTTIEFPAGLTLAEFLNAASNSSVTIAGNFVGQIEVHQDATVLLNGGTAAVVGTASRPAVRGLGTLSIMNSIVALKNNLTSAFNGTLSVDGTSTVTLQSFVAPNLQVLADTVSIIGDGLSLSGTTSVRGTFTATGAGLSISGPTTVLGSIVVTNSTLSITSSGALYLTTPTSLTIDHSKVQFGGFILGEVKIPWGSSLTVFGNNNGTIAGHLTNSGTITATPTTGVLYVYGNYSQTLEGVLAVSLTSNDDASLIVTNGTLAIAGKLRYTIKSKPFLKSVTFLVATTNTNVTGAFNGTASPLDGSEIKRELSVEYDQKNVHVKYNFHADDVDTWMWVVLAVVIAVIIVASIAVIVKCRKRVDYEPVR